MTAIVASSVIFSIVYADELKGRGASFPGPVYKAWTAAYFAATDNKVNYMPTGSGDGIKSLKKADLSMFSAAVDVIFTGCTGRIKVSNKYYITILSSLIQRV